MNAGGVVMYEDREQRLLIAQNAVSVAMDVPAGEDRILVALQAILQQVAPSRIDAFWVALIERSMETVRPFLAVYGDEFLANQERGDGPPESAPPDRPVDLLNEVPAHATGGDYGLSRPWSGRCTHLRGRASQHRPRGTDARRDDAIPSLEPGVRQLTSAPTGAGRAAGTRRAF